MLDRKRLISCLLLSVVGLGFSVSQANAASTQQVVILIYMGYARLTVGRFSGAVQPAAVELVLGGGLTSDLIAFTTIGYWNFGFSCEAIAIYGGDGGVSASCADGYEYAKFWVKGLPFGLGSYSDVPATLNFYASSVRGQFIGTLESWAIP